MKIIFWGTPDFCTPIFEAIHNSTHDIVAVVTQPDKRRGRGNKLTFSPVKQLAITNNIPYFTPKNINKDIATKDKIHKLNADLFIVVAFGQILSKEILTMPSLGCWNIHASLLPKWRGAAPIQWCLLNGDKETGVAIMLMEQGLDTGPVLLEEKIEITPTENASSLALKLSLISSKLIIKAIDKIERSNIESNSLDKLNLINQSDINRKQNYARLLNKNDYHIDWNDSTINIHRKVLGLYPNTYSIINNKRMKIIEAFPFREQYYKYFNYKSDNIIECYKNKEPLPGQIISYIKSIGILVQTKDSLLLITKIKLEGKKEALSDSLIQQITSQNGNIILQ